MQAKDIMSTPALTVPADATLEDAAKRMIEASVGSLVVVDADGNARSLITERDFMPDNVPFSFARFAMPRLWGRWVDTEGLDAIYAEARKVQVGKHASRPLHAVQEDDSVEHIVDIMLEHDIKHIPVLRGTRPIGMVARHDLLRVMAGRPRPSRRA